ncbi:hypothetical protein [Cohnella nanjingensis]|uniref:Uncharacterized protein n=1 Tax=Cohnella nanjingensis TaxID=1387779 RepID=A0A7X0RVQ7_9BACL|nr:hypothetical protein [Cohnella nanjingensis]MBB6674481.1 hypothetical protein [Cohnella nanjingensis]
MKRQDRKRQLDRWRRAERLLLLALWLAVAGFTGGMIAAGWPQYWIYVAAETTPQGWLESVLLVLGAALAGLNALLAAGKREAPAPEPTARRRVRFLERREGLGWTVVAAVFAWLALDERFALHERLRDRYLEMTGVRLLPWMEAGDWLIPLYAVCGLCAMWGLWRLLGARKAARGFFALGIVAAAAAVGMDAVDTRQMDESAVLLLLTIKEGWKTAATTAFASAFLFALSGRIREAAGIGAPTDRAEMAREML